MREDTENSIRKLSDDRLYELIFDMHQLPDSPLGAEAQAELDRRRRNHETKMLAKQLLISKINLGAAFSASFIAGCLLALEVVKYLSGP